MKGVPEDMGSSAEVVAKRKTGYTPDVQGKLWTRRLGRVAIIAFLTVLAASFLMPLYWMVTGAFKLQRMTYEVPPQLIPANPTMLNWVTLFSKQYSAGRWLFNSVLVSLLTAFLVVAIASMTGYGFAKKKFPGSRILFSILLATMFLPAQVLFIPLFVMVKNLHLTNTTVGTYMAMCLPMLSSPFGVFLVRQFAVTIPDELFEAAIIDGASEWGLYTRIALPLMAPALATLAIFTFNLAWNYFLWHLVIVTDRAMYTIPVGVSYIARTPAAGKLAQDFGLTMAGGTFGAFFMIVFFIAFQRYFVKGLTMGAVKG
jgi:multiple sugar transport system permease protein